MLRSPLMAVTPEIGSAKFGSVQAAPSDMMRAADSNTGARRSPASARSPGRWTKATVKVPASWGKTSSA